MSTVTSQTDQSETGETWEKSGSLTFSCDVNLKAKQDVKNMGPEVIIMKAVTYFENEENKVSFMSPLDLKPKCNIRLVRSKTPSNECSIYSISDSSPLSKDISNLPPAVRFGKEIHKSLNNDKYKGVFQTLRTFVKRKPWKSVVSISSRSISVEDLRKNTLPLSAFSKTQSYSSFGVHPSSSDNLHNQLLSSGLNESNGGTGTNLEVSKSTTSRQHVAFGIEPVNNSDEYLMKEDWWEESGHTDSNEITTPDQPSASPNAIEGSETCTMKKRFSPGMPGKPRGRIRLRLSHHLVTYVPAADGEESHSVKDATHVQPLHDGEAMVTDILSNNMILFGTDGHPKLTFWFEQSSEPWAVCLTPQNHLAVTLKRQGCVSLWSMSGQLVKEFGMGLLTSPTGIQCDRQGRFVVTDESANAVFLFTTDGELETKLEQPRQDSSSLELPPPQPVSRSPSPNLQPSFFKHPRYVCVTNAGNYVIADSANHSVKIFDDKFKLLHQFGSYGRKDGHFKFPYGVACDDENNLYVADHFNNRVSVFSERGEFIEHVLTDRNDIKKPKSVAIKDSHLYVSHGDLRSNNVSVFKIIRKQLI